MKRTRGCSSLNKPTPVNNMNMYASEGAKKARARAIAAFNGSQELTEAKATYIQEINRTKADKFPTPVPSKDPHKYDPGIHYLLNEDGITTRPVFAEEMICQQQPDYRLKREKAINVLLGKSSPTHSGNFYECAYHGRDYMRKQNWSAKDIAKEQEESRRTGAGKVMYRISKWQYYWGKFSKALLGQYKYSEFYKF